MSQMYGKQRIILKGANARGHQKVVQAGSSSGQGGSYHELGVWYQEGGRFFADLKSEEQEYQLLAVRDLGVKRFGGVATKTELRAAIAKHRGF